MKRCRGEPIEIVLYTQDSDGWLDIFVYVMMVYLLRSARD